jgi:hypothetical protein
VSGNARVSGKARGITQEAVQSVVADLYRLEKELRKA